MKQQFKVGSEKAQHTNRVNCAGNESTRKSIDHIRTDGMFFQAVVWQSRVQ